MRESGFALSVWATRFNCPSSQGYGKSRFESIHGIKTDLTLYPATFPPSPSPPPKQTNKQKKQKTNTKQTNKKVKSKHS